MCSRFWTALRRSSERIDLPSYAFAIRVSCQLVLCDPPTARKHAPVFMTISERSHCNRVEADAVGDGERSLLALGQQPERKRAAHVTRFSRASTAGRSGSISTRFLLRGGDKPVGRGADTLALQRTCHPAPMISASAACAPMAGALDSAQHRASIGLLDRQVGGLLTSFGPSAMTSNP